jgi:DNA-directed RNA polymerase specialized sigma24 family protein
MKEPLNIFDKVARKHLATYKQIIAGRLGVGLHDQDVDDVYQLALITVWQHLKDEELPEENVEKWLETLLQRAVSWELSVFIRAKAKWPEVDTLDAVMEATDECCIEVSESLPNPMRRVLESFMLYGCNLDIAADRVNMDPATFTRRLRLIHTFLKMKGYKG